MWSLYLSFYNTRYKILSQLKQSLQRYKQTALNDIANNRLKANSDKSPLNWFETFMVHMGHVSYEKPGTLLWLTV